VLGSRETAHPLAAGALPPCAPPTAARLPRCALPAVMTSTTFFTTLRLAVLRSHECRADQRFTGPQMH
jgi:hypothetical protein